MNFNNKSHSGEKYKIVFFGTSEFAVIALETFKQNGLIPDAIVTTPDKPQGRKLIMTAPPVKKWATELNEQTAENVGNLPNKIPVFQFEKLADFKLPFTPDLFIVASYGKIIPQSVLDMPKHGALNIHPSLLPEYRGATPLQTAILDDKRNTGVTIIKMDEKMDHGDIVAVRKVDFKDKNWPPTFGTMEYVMAVHGANLLLENLDNYLQGKIDLKPQDHSLVTFTKKITKQDGEISILGEAGSDEISPEDRKNHEWKNYLKFQAFEEWPGTFFFIEKPSGEKIRVKIKSAYFENDKMIIERVTPEGGREMDYTDFLRGL
jgi:methionyl-tRNA formyltransferase